MDRKGNAAAVWLQARSHGKTRAVASFRPAGGDFGAVQKLSAPHRDAYNPAGEERP